MSVLTVKPSNEAARFYRGGLQNLQPESPGAPTVYMPSPISGGAPPLRFCPDGLGVSPVERDRSEIPVYQQENAPSAPSPKTAAQYFDSFARFSALVAGLFTTAVGVCRLLRSNAYLRWPSDDFLADVNAESWRQKLFVLGPAAVVDLWTPFVFGIVSLHAHAKLLAEPEANVYLIHSVWSTVQALFANFGYCGGLGITAGVLSALSAAMSVVSYMTHCRTSDATGTLKEKK
ncbi:transmembrane protein [Cystoisospora suis]|uniref:Transmembrane protein n=1 Tax=Cystoisospora suis TaxID=483139 RepID=A0A2C6LCJ1_9APIC|nr:transmembrane protein [Cystoisospora suis]